MKKVFDKVIGVEQIDDELITHTSTDFRPILAFAVFILFTVAVLIVIEVTK